MESLISTIEKDIKIKYSDVYEYIKKLEQRVALHTVLQLNNPIQEDEEEIEFPTIENNNSGDFGNILENLRG